MRRAPPRWGTLDVGVFTRRLYVSMIPSALFELVIYLNVHGNRSANTQFPWSKTGRLEGLQPVVQQSTICPSGSRALRSQTWLRKIDARSCIDSSSYQTTRRNFLRRFCEAMSGFAKLLSPWSKLWFVALLVGALQLISTIIL